MKRRAFTLVELLVVISILAVLAGLILPAIASARARAKATRTKSDLQVIATALTAYKQDFGDCPRIAETAKAPGGAGMYADLANANYFYGAEILCLALVGPYSQNGDGHYYDTPPDLFDIGDGADGPGFRGYRILGADDLPYTTDDACRGKVTGSYLNTDRFRYQRHPLMRRYHALVDQDGYQILYYLARPAAITNPAQGYATRGNLSMWDMRDNEPAFATTNDTPASRLAKWQIAMGNKSATGYIPVAPTSSGMQAMAETPITGNFLLWAAGPDGQYGTDDDIKVAQ
jgi:prepilin-type N-terminal cleavage/methylation domain-containing protein